MMGGALLNKCRGELKINEVLDHFVRYVIRNNDNDNLFIYLFVYLFIYFLTLFNFQFG